MTKDTSLLHKEQLESLTEIGAYLRQVREDYSWTLDDVASRTMIQARLLRAIEEGRLDQLPEPVYVQGFIKLYADALGLNGSAFADAFPTGRQIQMSHSSWKDSPAAQLRPLHLYLAYIALIMASVSLLSYVVGRSPVDSSIANSPINPQPSVRPERSPDPGQVQAGTIGGVDLNANRSPQARPDPDKPVRVALKLTAQSWLRIVIDGETEFEGVLPEGTERSWSAQSELIVRAGNAGGVLLAYNSGKAERMGAPGAVEEKTFSASQDAASLPNPSSVQQ
ncbi:MAG: helix-turn-helix domain-containing protein [Cyanobacteria bacterium CRU_2_1]|nr:helix-turn-helix domain-containing protein [Cyanobacteria bacterium RU_5_0]NJR59748.1 helix-turn-helix domain-containing protein [Cyanobacteria bacterium CRU_2_1]